MQRVCEVPGGVKAYLEKPLCLLSDDTRRCPFCKEQHRLRLHGWYKRQLLEAASTEVLEIWVLRLLCPREGRTVSLLPDFCLPERQHSPGVLGLFLVAFLKGATLLRALRSARADAPGYSTAQSLLAGFLANLHRLRAYLAAKRARVVEPPEEVAPERRALGRVVFALLLGFPSVTRAFEQHARLFHHRYGLSLA